MNRRAIIYPLIILVLAATAVLVVRSGRKATDEQVRLERILSLLELDHELLWRQRPNLRTALDGWTVATDGHGFRISAAHSGGNSVGDGDGNGDGDRGGREPVRIVTFGASPTFGYGAGETENYPFAAESLLRERGFDAEVKNAGQIGYSSYQGRMLIERQADSLQPDIATVSYMVNDIDRLRFFFSNGKPDSEVEPPSRLRSNVVNFLDRVPGSTALQRAGNRIFGSQANERRCRVIREISRRRVEPGEYARNLVRIRDILSERGASVLFVALPFRLPEPVPPEPPGIEAALYRADSLLAAGAVDESWREILRIRELDPFSSRGSYLEAKVLDLRGEKESAEEAWCRAVEEIIYDCARDAALYNDIMRSVAEKTGTPLLDVSKSLEETGDAALFFLEGDYIHPSARGHAFIGRLLVEKLAGMITGNPAE